MSILSPAVCFLWGGAATYCFFNAWFALIGVIASVIGLLRRQMPAAAFLRMLYAQVTIGAAHGLVLALFFTICWQRLQLGRSRLEITFFMVAAVAVMICLLPSIPQRIDRLWKTTNPDDGDPQ